MRKADWSVRNDLVVPTTPEVTFDFWIEWAARAHAAADLSVDQRERLSPRERLAMLEAELRRRLEDQLERAAHGTNPLFFVTREFNPHGLATSMIQRTSEELSRLASEALALRETLGEPAEGSVGFAFRRALRQAANLSDPQRPVPGQRAEHLLAELVHIKG